MLKLLNDRPATETEHYAFLNEGEYPQKYAPEYLLSRVWEIDEATYWYFLEMMPPLDWQAGAFAICECVTADIYCAYFDIGGKFYCAYYSRKDRISIINRKFEIIDLRDKGEAS